MLYFIYIYITILRYYIKLDTNYKYKYNNYIIFRMYISKTLSQSFHTLHSLAITT